MFLEECMGGVGSFLSMLCLCLRLCFTCLVQREKLGDPFLLWAETLTLRAKFLQVTWKNEPEWCSDYSCFMGFFKLP